MTAEAAMLEPLPGPAAVVEWEPDLNTFGARLALVRQRMGWNMAEAARACGIPTSNWEKWEKGVKCRDKEGVSRKISSATGCRYLWLYAGPDVPRAQAGGSVAHDVTLRWLGRRVRRSLGVSAGRSLSRRLADHPPADVVTTLTAPGHDAHRPIVSVAAVG